MSMEEELGAERNWEKVSDVMSVGVERPRETELSELCHRDQHPHRDHPSSHVPHLWWM